MAAKLLPEWRLFQGVLPETLERLEQCGRVRALAKGELIIQARQPQQDVYIQMTGKSMVYDLTHTGDRKILFIFGPGALLNEHVLNLNESSTYCEAIEPGTAFAAPTSEFLRLMKGDFALTCGVLAAQERKIWRLGHQLKNTVGSIYLERKLAAKLWKLSRDFGIPGPEGIEIDVTLPVTMLADMLGAPRETTSRLCKKLVDHGLIRMTGKRIYIADPEKMSHFYKTGTY